MRIILIIVTTAALSACTFQTVYLKPAIKGQIIDIETNQPIANQGYIASFLEDNNKNAVKTDSNGFFYLKEVTDDNLIKFNAHEKFQNIPQEIYIYISGYENKTFNFSKFPKNPKSSGIYTKSEIDIGKVYLHRES